MKAESNFRFRCYRTPYTKAGTRLSAAVVDDPEIVIDHMAYWAPIRRVEEARYLRAVINSEAVLQKVAPMQPRGSVGRRHFDKLVWELPIRDYDAENGLHCEIATAGAEAERIAAALNLPSGNFQRKRRAVRDALTADGVAWRGGSRGWSGGCSLDRAAKRTLRVRCRAGFLFSFSIC